MTPKNAVAAAQIREAFRANVAELRAAYNASTPQGYVFVWPEHWLAVQFDSRAGKAVRVDHATVVSFGSNWRAFTNGKNQRAILMNRQEALRNALAHAISILEDFEANLSAKEI